MTNYIRRKQQRGVILLAIISILTMFMLIGITYVVVSGHFKRAAVTNSKIRQLEVPPQKHLDGAMYQLLRDTNYKGSVVRGHSLLQDKYGHFALRGKVISTTYDFLANKYPAGNQILKIKVKLVDPKLANPASPLSLEPLSNPGALTGRVITILNGTFQNVSGRILKSTRNKFDEFTLRILFPKTVEHLPKNPLNPTVVFNDKIILINGRDFSGTGFGLDMDVATGESSGKIKELALQPNRATDEEDVFDKFRQGGANEGYDVPDYQNMAMAAQLSDPTGRELEYIIPSFHRPALINYHIKQGAPPATMAKVVMRPRQAEHPSFDGSNPSFDPINGPWDVDNDGDGIRDSIWIDMGFPVQTDSSGRRYKPLFAVLCLDMDGRLNLNAHGNKSHYELAANIRRGMGYGPAEINLINLLGSKGYEYLLTGKTNPPLKDPNVNDAFEPKEGYVPGRYRRDGSPGYAGIDRFSYYIFGHFPANFVNSQKTSFQSMPDIHGELGYEIDPLGNVVSQVSTDLAGNLRNTIADNPYEANLVSPNAADQLFSALEMETLLRYHDPDNPQFNNSYARNSYSWNANGSSRLYQLTNAFNGDSNFATANRRSVTTASFDPPVPAVQIPAELRYDPDPKAPLQPQYNMGSHASQLLRARMLQDATIKTELAKLGNDPAKETLLNQRMSGLLAPKIFDGLRMDVNRPFGNGIDDNGDGVVDNRFESDLPERLWPSVFDNANKVWFDHDNDGFAKFADPDAFLARYHYARHLYVLMLLMKDKNRRIDFNGDGNETGNSNETHRNIAQWAVNAVDFRDADSIMTPFEFDLNPFNGWDVDGDINTVEVTADRALVWGTERPELLITESLAFHDRRTEDLDIDGDGGAGDVDTFQDPELNTRAGRAGLNDEDFDQRLLPNSGVFFELYNPWNSVYENKLFKGSKSPAEFYQNVDSLGRVVPAAKEGVRLDQLSYYGFDDDRLPNGNTDIKDADRSPVWRMIIVRGVDKLRDPDAWDTVNNPLTIERAIYFVNGAKSLVKIPNADTVKNTKDVTERFFYRPNDPNNLNQQPKPLEPGQYARIGSGTYNGGTKTYPTYIGRHKDSDEAEPKEWNGWLAKTSSIVLDPINNDPINNNFIDIPINYHYMRTKDNEGKPVPEEKSLSITEPVFGYRNPLTKEKFPTKKNNVGEPILVTTRDVPLDAELIADPITEISRLALNVGGRMPGIDPISNTKLRRGTTNDFAAVHLQRLANPLKPHDKETNPYRTIDTASIDVTAFNGVYKKLKADPVTMEVLDPPELVRPTPLCDGLKDVYNGNLVERVRFNSLERGWSKPLGSNMLWKNEPARNINGPPTALNDISEQIFRYDGNATLGQRNSSYPANNNVFFPWLQWNNRPFVSQLELMMVPRSSASQLLKDYSFNNSTAVRNPYKAPLNNVGNPNETYTAYGHLLNFLESDQNRASSNFHRLFDYTEVQSYFTGAQTYLNPHVFQDDGVRPADPQLTGIEELRPPFNRITNYRDPGRINMNTIFDRYVFEGLMNNHSGATYADWDDSRRGYTPKQLMPPLHDDYPTFFANPIKPAGSGDMVPLLKLEKDDVEVSLLRNNPTKLQEPLFSTGYTNPNENASRNPTFEYQSLQRLGNLTTGRSNVYSVWITVGYFEVAQFNGKLGVEVGIDEGRIKRHRAFYMIDRSIPVAFEPGENHNVDNAVILRRYVD
ncbi:MAG: hypothetical protein HOJ62_11940 [Planctomycetaceae bacterium]|nr:hypothetical protein [Planctomycetaceae bacterium]